MACLSVCFIRKEMYRREWVTEQANIPNAAKVGLAAIEPGTIDMKSVMIFFPFLFGHRRLLT